MTSPVPRLSKSRVQSGHQCLLKLWYEVYDRGLATPPGDAQQHRFDRGILVGELARRLHPDGRRVEAEYHDVESALQQTQAMLADESIPALFEAAFVHRKVVVRVDVLVRGPGGAFDLIEVKSATKPKEVHVRDAAIQYWAMTGAGLEVDHAGILTLDRSYVFDGEQLELEGLFAYFDRTEKIRAMQPEIAESIRRQQSSLSADEPPKIAVGPHCRVPYDCAFLEHCSKDLPAIEHPVSSLHNLDADKKRWFAAEGIREIAEIDDDFPLTDLQRRIRRCVVERCDWGSPELRAALESVEVPVHYLDFETCQPAIPRYAGTSPFDQIPFQYSIHRQERDGSVHHLEYLHDDDSEPSRDLATRLLHDLQGSGGICVYSGFERGVILRLAKGLPDLAPELKRLVGRLWDLLPIIRKHYYHPAFKGSFSIKSVLPAVVPELSYDGLTIQDGMEASRIYEALLDTRDPAERGRINASLLEYCGLDTRAMLELRKALLERESERESGR